MATDVVADVTDALSRHPTVNLSVTSVAESVAESVARLSVTFNSYLTSAGILISIRKLTLHLNFKIAFGRAFSQNGNANFAT